LRSRLPFACELLHLCYLRLAEAKSWSVDPRSK
jgi:hypothetical protein